MNRVKTLLMLLILALPLQANANELISALTSQLGVSESQASGGLGALLATAAPNLSQDSLGSLANIIPNMDGLLASGGKLLESNQGEASSGLMGLITSSTDASSLLNLNSAFSSLGLDSDMVGQFSKVLLDYVDNQGGAGLVEQLKSALL
ncbi:DUF2780 domain-containing protein [Ferrimonas senticii]|uniref:DUF2780 domain-containing protein n=1 Tax=Ferrimonas senticii TaxID=394566 RepID=UPI00042674BC|nr:DUF2780 domain-containing protein [Ferrimonas senticii]